MLQPVRAVRLPSMTEARTSPPIWRDNRNRSVYPLERAEPEDLWFSSHGPRGIRNHIILRFSRPAL